MTPEKLQTILDQHQLWVSSGGQQGQRACLSGTNLSGTDLSYANLSKAYLIGANLSHANMTRANLLGANLSGATLFYTGLFGASLLDADLSDANLSGADLAQATLPFPIYQFCAGRFHAVATPTELRIGCEVHPWEVWLDEKKRQEIADLAKFTEKEYRTHSTLIITFHKLLCGKN